MPFRKELRADPSQGMPAVIQCKYFVFQFAVQKYKILRYTEL